MTDAVKLAIENLEAAVLAVKTELAEAVPASFQGLEVGIATLKQALEEPAV